MTCRRRATLSGHAVRRPAGPDGVGIVWEENVARRRCAGELYNPGLTPSNSRGLEKKQDSMRLPCLPHAGLTPQMLLVLFLKRAVMEGLMDNQILLLNLHHGSQLNSNYIWSKNSSD